jgi:general secretion pathway protein N
MAFRPSGFGALLFCVIAAVVAISQIPASWMARRIADATAGRVMLANSEGTLWRGSSELVLVGGPLAVGRWPGRIFWGLTPRWDGLAFHLDNRLQETSRGRLEGLLGWRQWQLLPGYMEVPTDLLVGLGAPFNTLRLEGPIEIRWSALAWGYGKVAPAGRMSVEIKAEKLASRLSPIAPLGSYDLKADWGPLGGRINLETLEGPLMLSGQGALGAGRLTFDGEASASSDVEPQLAGLLSILGKRDGAITRLHY